MQLDKPAAPVVARQTLVYANQAAACVLIASPARDDDKLSVFVVAPTRRSFCVGRPPKPLCMCASNDQFPRRGCRPLACVYNRRCENSSRVRGITFDTRARRGTLSRTRWSRGGDEWDGRGELGRAKGFLTLWTVSAYFAAPEPS